MLAQYVIIISFVLIVTLFMKALMPVTNKNRELSRNHNYRVNKQLLILFFIFFVVYSSFRVIERIPFNGYEYTSGGGSDAVNYKDLFLSATGNFFDYFRGKEIEPGFLFLLYFFRMFTDNFTVFLCFFYSVVFFCLYSVCKYYLDKKNFFLPFLAIAGSLVLTSFCLMRTAFATMIFAYATIKISQNKHFKACLLMLISISMHYSALISLPCYLLFLVFKKTKLNGIKIFLISASVFILGYIMGFSMIKVLSGTRYIRYFNEPEWQGFGLNLFIYRIVILFLFCYKIGFSSFDDNKKRIMLFLVVGNFFAFGLEFHVSLVYRMFGFADVGMLYMIHEILNACSKKTKDNYIENVLIEALIYMFLIYSIYKTFAETIINRGLVTYKSSLFK